MAKSNQDLATAMQANVVNHAAERFVPGGSGKRRGKANELERACAATVQSKNVNKINMSDDNLTDDDAEIMIAKLRRSGKYSVKWEQEKGKAEV